MDGSAARRGTGDALVPAAHPAALQRRLQQAGADVALHRTDVFEHVGAEGRPGPFATLRLLWFVGGWLDACAICGW